MLRRFLHADQHAERIDIHDAGEVCLGGFQKQAGLADAGIVEHDVEAAEGFHRRLDHAFDARPVDHINLKRNRLSAVLADHIGDALGRSEVYIGNGNPPALGRKIPRNCFADAAAGAGHDDRLLLNKSWQSVLLD